MDAEDVALTVDPESRHRLSAMSHQAYGPLVGGPRILELLREYELPATFFVPGLTAERYPQTVERILEAGRLAPSARNWQPWNFVVVSDRDRLRELARVWQGAGHVAGAAVAIGSASARAFAIAACITHGSARNAR